MFNWGPQSNTIWNMQFGEFLTSRRKVVAKSQKDVSNDISYSPQVISKWEKGISIPTVDLTLLLCSSLQISLDDFFLYKIDAPIINNIDVKQVVSLEGIKRLRRDKNLTQKQLGDILNLNEVSIMRYEKGESYPNIETFIALSKALGVKPSELLLNKYNSPQIAHISNKKKLLIASLSILGIAAISASIILPITLSSTKCVVTLDANGGIFSNGKTQQYISVKKGKTLQEFISPLRTGYTLVNWLYQDVAIDPLDYIINSDLVFTASWDINQYNISIVNEDDKGQVSGSGFYTYGDQVTLKATPLPNYRFGGWYEDTVLVESSQTYTFITPDYDRTLEARWIDTKYNVTIINENMDMGSISISEEGPYPYNYPIQLIATPSSDKYTFAGWWIEDEIISFKEQYTYLVEDKDVVIKARFSEKSYQYLDNGDGTITYSNPGSMVHESTIIVPSTLPDGKRITKIEDNAFQECDNLTTLVISDGIEELGNNLFSNHGAQSTLEHVTLSNDIKVLPDSLFYKQTKLTTVNIPNSLEEIGSNAFRETSKLNIDITIPESVKTIREGAFKYAGFKSIDFKCDEIQFEGSVFSHMEHIEELTLPLIKPAPGYTYSEPSSLFEYCNAKRIKLDDRQEVIGYRWFYGCKNLTELEFPKSLKEIDIAFNGSGLRRAILPNGLETIMASAFSNCAQLQYVYIPSSVTSINKTSFSNSPNITFYCEVDSAPSSWGDWNPNGLPVVWNATINDVPLAI